jgi:prepilin-type N-terminal cleavage/methylation domain-containing protein
MLRRLRAEDGMGLIELLAAMALLSIALMALLACFGSTYASLRLSSQKTTASELANSQVELYRALPYASIGLDDATVNDIGDDSSSDYNATYSDDPALYGAIDTSGVQQPSGTVNDVTIPNCSTVAPSAACAPVQTVTAQDHHSYEIDSYVVDLQTESTTTGVSWTERVVTVVIRNPEATGDPELLRISTAFDRLPAS